MEHHNFINLRNHILPRSVASEWDEAKHEWALDHVEVMDVGADSPPETCPCGHFPIVELCWIRNRKNEELTFVGNVCVKKFLGLPVDTVAEGIKRIMKDETAALNSAATVFAFEQGWITDWERNFCLDTAKKRKPSQKQLDKRVQINENLLRKLRERGLQRRSSRGEQRGS